MELRLAESNHINLLETFAHVIMETDFLIAFSHIPTSTHPLLYITPLVLELHSPNIQ